MPNSTLCSPASQPPSLSITPHNTTLLLNAPTPCQPWLTCDNEDLVELLWQQLQLAGQAQQHKGKLTTLTQQEASAD